MSDHAGQVKCQDLRFWCTICWRSRRVVDVSSRGHASLDAWHSLTHARFRWLQLNNKLCTSQIRVAGTVCLVEAHADAHWCVNRFERVPPRSALEPNDLDAHRYETLMLSVDLERVHQPRCSRAALAMVCKRNGVMAYHLSLERPVHHLSASAGPFAAMCAMIAVVP